MLHAGVVDGERRIRVDLNEPNSKVLIDHIIEAEQLERVASLVWIQVLLTGQISIDGKIFHTQHEVAVHVQSVLRELLFEVLLERREADDVALLVKTIRLLIPALKTVVGEVRQLESSRLVLQLDLLGLVRVR